jgi:hypothetical protein
MQPSFRQEDLARAHTAALSIATQRAAESAQFKRDERQRHRVRRSVGLRLVRVGLRMAGETPPIAFRGTS